jgi:hypothetical protein
VDLDSQRGYMSVVLLSNRKAAGALEFLRPIPRRLDLRVLDG